MVVAIGLFLVPTEAEPNNDNLDNVLLGLGFFFKHGYALMHKARSTKKWFSQFVVEEADCTEPWPTVELEHQMWMAECERIHLASFQNLMESQTVERKLF